MESGEDGSAYKLNVRLPCATALDCITHGFTDLSIELIDDRGAYVGIDRQLLRN
jgi:hypothetical protein